MLLGCRCYLAGLGVLEDLIMRGEHDAVVSCGFGGARSTRVGWIPAAGSAPQTPAAQHLATATELYFYTDSGEATKTDAEGQIYVCYWRSFGFLDEEPDCSLSPAPYQEHFLLA